MDYIMEYLKNPIKIGVCSCKARIDLKPYNKLAAYIVERCKRSERTRIRSYIKPDSYFSMKALLNKLSYALNELSQIEKCPKTISSFREKCSSGSKEKLPLHEQIFAEKPLIEILEPLILSEHNDVLSINVVSPSEDEFELPIFCYEDLEPLIVEIISVKDRGAKLFLKFLKSIPHIGNRVEVIKALQKTFSSRFSFQPYPLAVRLWLQENGKTTIPKDLQDFMDRAAVYHALNEWRTSIVLSAIVVESLLADLYEESYQEPSPERATLGELFEHVKKKVNFPSYIADSILKTNNARISAVHRSRLTVSEREATNALYGAVNLSMWYLSNFKEQS